MAMAILLALIHRQRTGEGQWVDLACTESALSLHGPALLDWTVNGNPTRKEVQPSSNRSNFALMAPHGIYPTAGEDEWIAIACRDNADWQALGSIVDADWCRAANYASVQGRLAGEDQLDDRMAAWTESQEKHALSEQLLHAGIPAAPVQTPEERVDLDPTTENFGLWPTVEHTEMGKVRVDGQPVHMSETDWSITRGAPCLGEHTTEVLTGLLGYSDDEVAALREEGVV